MSISKQKELQRYIFKIHTSRLRKNKWNMELSLAEARRNNELISMGSSQVLRWIDELNGVTEAEAKAREIKSQIRSLKSEHNSGKNRKEIQRLYAELDSIQFKPDYMSLVIDREKDYYRALKGFSINGIKYRRLVSTVGGMKTGTIVFVSDRLHDTLMERMENGRDMTKEMVPAKLEAYRALACSASIPVSMPKGILVVRDAETHFFADTIYLDDECDGEPKMEFRKNTEITMDCTDGFGLMSPSLAERWSAELGLDYVVSGVNTRFSFEKGMVFTFDFVRFAEEVAHGYMVDDAWGNKVDIRNVELILTESMLKLWDSYKSVDDYLENCEKNRYQIGVTKTCPGKLESERNLNYQFIQSYDLTDEYIDELISPTENEFTEVLGGDCHKTVLFLCGKGLNESSVRSLENNFAKAVLIEPALMGDKFIRDKVWHLIKNKIDEAKVGVLKVHGNYSIVSGDPYILCQNIFHMPLTGLLKAGEIYNAYWSELGADKLACFRAPMSCFNNIRPVHPVNDPLCSYWYKYMNTCTIFNAWDTATIALNGCDYDGDLVMLTDNRILVDRLYETPAVMCVQRKAVKKIVTEDDVVRSNLDSFGNDIGKVTNRVTSMFDVRSSYPNGSVEYEILDYRIKCGQLIQQNVIDKSKGIVAKPMPREWHDRHAVNKIEDEERRLLYRRIVADKKPYFMRYIYPDLMKQYNTYQKNTRKSALREFGMTVEEMKNVPEDELSEEQREFLKYYDMLIPVGMNDCVMNLICRKIERIFENASSVSIDEESFDYSIIKSGATYTPAQYSSVLALYKEYTSDRLDEESAAAGVSSIKESFVRECLSVCSDRSVLCDILIDICYKKGSTKKFVWEMFPDVIVSNLLARKNGEVSFPMMDPAGDISYCGEKFVISKTSLLTEVE